MVFSSPVFVFLFLPAVLGLYTLSFRFKAENIVLVAASLFFYAWGEPIWVVLLIFSALVDWCVSGLLGVCEAPKRRRALLAVSVCVNLGLLAFFKYSGFFIENLNALLPVSLPRPSFNLPIGISFYTFQTMSYTIDVYRQRVKPERGFLNFLMYVSLFPQLVAGPIVRYSDIENQVRRRRITPEGFSNGILRFVTGLSKKMLIANYAGQLCGDLIGGPLAGVSVAGLWFGLFMFMIQIYFDFSGYSDMAIGLGSMFGFTFQENFFYPYLSASITEFWRRWHISLSSFFKDYLYIPLGGNRSHPLRNMMVVWLLTGLWHGASWNFVLWGLYYGVILILEKKVSKGFMGRGGFNVSRLFNIPLRVLKHLYTLTVALAGWGLFYFVGLGRLGQALTIMFGISGHELTSAVDRAVIANNRFFILLAVLACLPWGAWMRGLSKHLGKSVRGSGVLAAARLCYCAVMLLCCTVWMAGSSFNPFIYFRF